MFFRLLWLSKEPLGCILAARQKKRKKRHKKQYSDIIFQNYTFSIRSFMSIMANQRCIMTIRLITYDSQM